ncbi:LOW QUALITY PROTEIN: hypothetical protein MKX08_000741 [Trichoderma sp. CBMAI-0020]|nr:LOW QUALITY PROTEIN: hypothetical protein MKX08_000741 [Trichoderma sp. CBMAI-0020]
MEMPVLLWAGGAYLDLHTDVCAVPRRVLGSGQAVPLCSAMLPFSEGRDASGVAMAATAERPARCLGLGQQWKIVNPPRSSWPKARCRNGAGRRDSLCRIQTARQGAGSLSWTEKSRGLKEYEYLYSTPFSLCSWCERIALLGPGDAWHDKNEGSGRQEAKVPSHADHAQCGVARLVQQRQCGRCFGDAEAAVSHRLGYSNT